MGESLFDDGSTPEGNEESGSALRKKLEEALKQNRILTDKVRKQEAAQVVSAKGLKYVTPEDLSEVPLDQLEARALELEDTKAAAEKATIARVFASKGLEGDELEVAVESFLANGEVQVTQTAVPNLANLSRLPGVPPKAPEFEGVFGPSRLRAAMNAEKKTKS